MLCLPVALALVATATSPAPSTEPLPTAAEPIAFSPVPVVAEGENLLSYTYVELGAARFDVDDFDDEVDIYYLRGSLGLFELFYVFGEYQNQELDFEDTRTDQIQLGVGAHFGASPKLDLYAEVGWLYSDIESDLDDLDESDNGYEVMVGARWMVLPWDRGGLELNGGVGYIDLDNRLASDETASQWEIGARAHFLQFLSVGLTYSMLEDDDQVLGGVRFSF